jgi:hypothetical protein
MLNFIEIVVPKVSLLASARSPSGGSRGIIAFEDLIAARVVDFTHAPFWKNGKTALAGKTRNTPVGND